MTEIVDIQGASPEMVRDAIHQAVQAILNGELIVIPSDAVYFVVASSGNAESVDRLNRMFPEEKLTLLLKSRDEALDYLPLVGIVGRKIMDRGWPGPLVLSFAEELSTGVHRALSDKLRSLLLDKNRLSLHVPSDNILQEILRLVPCPLVCSGEQTSLDRISGREDEIQALMKQGVTLVLNNGLCRFGQRTTHVEVNGNKWAILQQGVVTETMVGRLSNDFYLFVCTGNTCRSPMAEGLFRKFLSERLQCREDELADRGFVIASAGLGAYPGSPASEESILALKKYGIHLEEHASQPVTEELLKNVDYIFTMTRSHRDVILSSHPELASRIELLSREARDISDPIGGGPEDYEMACQDIEQNVRLIIDNLELT